ncbi:hypothetical protein AB0J35_55590 [Nonomuraea angiospora]|uniref:hypothetical protein n=1 Tax=Nonomuraea angiospora TaxID=46172 RepID=UPI00343907DF
MADLQWEEVKDLFDTELNGVLPDVCVPGTSIEDWQAVFDLVLSKGWRYEYSVDGIPLRLPAAKLMMALRDEAGPHLKVWPHPDVLAIFHPYAEESVDFDVDLRELQGQERLDVLCGFLRAIVRRLGKPVVMTPEGDPEHPVLGFDVTTGRVVLMAELR